MNVDVNVEYTLVEPQQLDDGEHDIWKTSVPEYLTTFKDQLTVHVAESAGLAFFGMMQATGPVHCYITLASVESCGTLHTATCTYAAELEQSIEDGTVITDIVFALLFLETVHVIWRHLVQEVDVLVSVKLGHLKLGCWFGALSRTLAEAVNRYRKEY